MEDHAPRTESLNPRGPLGERTDESEPVSPDEVLRRLSDYGQLGRRYQTQEEIARGGMGAILKVWDRSLSRHLAMKVILPRGDAPTTSQTRQTDSISLSRFLEEGQVTAQLDHPGIVPVHELGLDGEGRVYFTMKLVKGEDLRSILDKLKDGREGWTQTRVLGVLLKVCEAMAYAHAKGVIHRDLKPGNVMVGRFGEVYVMDWGLARVQDREDRKDLRILHASPTTALRSERKDLADAAPDSPLMTMDGDVVGTPAYMPPEQALGHLDEMGAHSDVYAVGCILYHLLAGHMPYVKPGMRLSNHAVWYRVQEGPPESLRELAREAPSELVAICEKAMTRDWRKRYRDMGELAEDLRAFLEGRVVRAYQTGTLAELRKWMERNRGLAIAIAVGILVLLVGLTASLILKEQSDRNALRAEESQRIAEERRALAEQKEKEARESRDEVLRLSASQRLADLVAEADGLWPAAPENLPPYEDWLARARALIAGLDPSTDGSDRGYRMLLAELRARALPTTEADVGAASGRSAAKDPALRFVTEEDRWWHGQLQALVAGTEALADPARGLIDGLSAEHGWGIARRREWASHVTELSVTGVESRRRWQEALASIADVQACPLYGGLRMIAQLGLLPIGRDIDSGLWEFAHLASGEPPGRDAEGRLVLTEASALVLVLLPGGPFTMGAQSSDPQAPNHDPWAQPDEGPVHSVTLSPFFLSKYEMTQGQWSRSTGQNPSLYGPAEYQPEWNRSGRRGDLLQPVERVSWDDCAAMCMRLDLVLPSEAQWEYAARCGRTGTVSSLDLSHRANLADAWARAHGGPPAWPYETWDDGNALHATVGSYAPDAFGLHDMLGNLWEWCRDGYSPSAYAQDQGRDPVTTEAGSPFRITRGGAFTDPAGKTRFSQRNPDTPGRADANLGLRPAKSVTNPISDASSRR